MFHINSISGVDIRAYSASPLEAEILLVPGTCLKVQGILPVGGGVTIIQMDETRMKGLVDFARDQLQLGIANNLFN